MIADAEAVEGRKNFIIIILIERIPMDELPRELRTYMRTYTYIDATKNKDQVTKRLRSNFVTLFIIVGKTFLDFYRSSGIANFCGKEAEGFSI